jgi:uncharacterized integral membrane protein
MFTPVRPGNAAGSTHPTRAAVIWGAVAASLVILVLLIIFFIQNQDMIAVKFLGWEGSLAQGVAFFIAAVGGGILVAIAGGDSIPSAAPQRKATAHEPRPINHQGRTGMGLEDQCFRVTSQVRWSTS